MNLPISAVRKKLKFFIFGRSIAYSEICLFELFWLMPNYLLQNEKLIQLVNQLFAV